MKIGLGYDVHKLVYNRPLILGGVNIPFEKGLMGHSDADVLLHAIMDSLLGALCLGDIGKHFPDNDNKYKNICSLKLLSHVSALINEKGYTIGNIDSIIIAEKPKLSSYIQDMRVNIAKTLNVTTAVISVKATTEEGLGFTGKGEGIAAQSICLLTANSK
ncbi:MULTISPECIES: 2-C-methyl-D-erythritol 2,4-cyclodiphosphate synthase [Clostridium]|uniref:2-C-methyl-D-erythritol 2,4-cyclodiphosphate synthase n=3 Tax=Clostridium TaxID=1485 RepID=D8GKR4_CLOLD|nr:MULTISPECIES: 2-C-methyl-D-erythritol 2,4-cyclodiphosphate synthase [Clostridium]ADK13247.1 2-C-methyl-D-erythritol 2,4-cyclodiphosphate synthase [Clostridium ljungdahlii DSM 13528]AGY76474.1 2-C-methyl-D-erythritol 2,4-cyclodiphosphate synthase [Clostridium autoethanogenum DSM 10061]ALU36636.1 2-C-methyl-D-erythritol 2,4-cyclodiphosphate synthase [Clostridium autoethanogenum DSM 10061]OAA83694.1 2-C-methyl-D-erythritol 2,4-cyclodiphosphate synthase [Clostridium ljungdahlii DSM 13528]OVY506